jgi:hypothetical protein
MAMLTAGIVAAGIYLSILPYEARTRLAEAGMPPAIMAAVGIALQTESWRRLLVQGTWSAGPLIGATLGAVAAVTGGTILRELRRTAAIDLAAYTDAHATAGRIGGMPLFVLFLAANTIVIYFVISLVRRGLRPEP